MGLVKVLKNGLKDGKMYSINLSFVNSSDEDFDRDEPHA